MPVRLSELVYAVDRIAETLRSIRVVARKSHTFSKSIGRFNMVIPHTIVPIAFEKEGDFIDRASILEDTSIYIHEDGAILLSAVLGVESTSIVNSMNLLDLSRSTNATAIRFDEVDDVILAILASSIVLKYPSLAQSKRIAKVLPSNIRIYFEKAVDVSTSNLRGSLRDIAYVVMKEISAYTKGKTTKKMLELRIWKSSKKDIDEPIEISYVKGFGGGYFRIRFLGGEANLRIHTSIGAETILPKFISYSILDDIERNIRLTLEILIRALNTLKPEPR